MNQSTQQSMFLLITQWKDSGKSQKEFCDEHAVTYSKFHYWLQKYRHQQPIDSASSSFVRVQIAGEALPCAVGLEVVYPDGRRLIFKHPVEALFLRNLMG